MKHRAIALSALVLTGSVTVIALCNYLFLQRHLSEVVNADPRNSGIKAIAHYKFFVLPSSLVFDLRKVSGETSPMDITRVFLQFSASIKDNSFADVTLSYRGHPKFALKGDYFHSLGVEYGTQNPMYTVRTLPENVYNLDGTSAFSTWTGGLFGVLAKQMQDFSEFHKQWYLEEMIKNGN